MKFSNGAIVFWTSASKVIPADPQEMQTQAVSFGLDPALVPEYAGDRRTVGRAKSACDSALKRQGWIIGNIRASAMEVVYGLMRETKDQDRKELKHDFECALTWRLEAPEHIENDAAPMSEALKQALTIEAEYQSRRGRIVAADWAESITSYLIGDCQGSALREDGRVYWVPPQKMAALDNFKRLLSLAGISLVTCEIEAHAVNVVKQQAEMSLEDELEALHAEANSFDGTQKPSTYAARLEAYNALKARAIAYRDALGVSVQQTIDILLVLDEKVNDLLKVRKTTTIKRQAKEVEFSF